MKALLLFVTVCFSTNVFAQFGESKDITPAIPPKVKNLSTVFHIDASQIQKCIQENEINAPERNGSGGYGRYLDKEYTQKGFECQIPHKTPLTSIDGFVEITNNAVIDALVLNVFEDYPDEATIAKYKLNVRHSAEEIMAISGGDYEGLESMYFRIRSAVSAEGWPDGTAPYPSYLNAWIRVTPENLIIGANANLKGTKATIFKKDFTFIHMMFDHLLQSSDSKIDVEYTVLDK